MEEEPVNRLQHLSDAVTTMAFVFSCLSRVSNYFGLMFSPLVLQLFMNLCIRSSSRSPKPNNTLHVTGHDRNGSSILTATYFSSYLPIAVQLLLCMQTLKTKIFLQFHFILLLNSSVQISLNLLFR